MDGTTSFSHTSLLMAPLFLMLFPLESITMSCNVRI